jgi:ribosome-associated protein
MDKKELMENIVKVLDENKGIDIEALEITELTTVADYFVIVTGTSSTHVRALTEDVENGLSKLGVEPERIEGKATGWILMDYGSVIVHIFTADMREHFNLEHLWADAKNADISNIVTE